MPNLSSQEIAGSNRTTGGAGQFRANSLTALFINLPPLSVPVSFEHIRCALEDLGPTFVKIGQITSLGRDIRDVEFYKSPIGSSVSMSRAILIRGFGGYYLFHCPNIPLRWAVFWTFGHGR